MPKDATETQLSPNPELRGEVLVLGMGRSGIAAASLLLRASSQPVLLDDASHRLGQDDVQELVRGGAKLAHGDPLPDASLLITSPGVPSTHPLIRRCHAIAIPVWSELELASRFCSARIIAVTGSDGKSTTCALMAHTLERAGLPVVLGGNIGIPFSDIAQSAVQDGFAVVEVSSYQLEHAHTFSPWVAMLLNLAPDHLARHGTMENYAATKARIFAFQNADSWIVLNADQSELRRLLPDSSAGRLEFSLGGAVKQGAALSGSWLVEMFQDREQRQIMRMNDLLLPGRHNIGNALAVIAALAPLQLEQPKLAAGLGSFEGLRHRLQTVGTRGGVLYVNDSKATNVHSAVTGLQSFPDRVFLLAGGKDKGLSFAPLADAARGHAKLLIAFGEAGERLVAEFGNTMETIQVEDLDQAVLLAHGRAVSGDTVLLSPACSSFDAYSSFEERGEHFISLVKGLRD